MGKNFFHLFRIARVLAKHDLGELLRALPPLRPLAFCFRALAFGVAARRKKIPRARRLREALEELGPVFVKFGQMLSTRPDLLPEDIAAELVSLQDAVPPFSGEEARAVVAAAYADEEGGDGKRRSRAADDDLLKRYFKSFEEVPAASASVAQVHYAQLLDGSEVVVKVLRPKARKLIARDLRLLHSVAALAERHWREAPRFKPKQVVSDYDKTIHHELDLMREAANASQLKANFADSDLIHVPRVYWEYTRRNVMVMERIHGIPIRDIARLKAARINLKTLAHNGVEIFFTQAFRHGFFHADMHPGNIFVSPQGQYRAVDFGIMGALSEGDKRYLAENLLAFFHRDYRRVADAHIRAGWVPPGTVAEDFEGAIRTVCEPIFAKPISEISFGRFLISLFRVAHSFKMPVQPQLVLLQKTLLNIEGLGRQLYPQLNLWETAKPFLERWSSEQVGARAALRELQRELPNLVNAAPQLPGLLHQILLHLKNDSFTLATRDQEVANLTRHLARGQRRIVRGLVVVGVLLGILIAVGGGVLAGYLLGWDLV